LTPSHFSAATENSWATGWRFTKPLKMGEFVVWAEEKSRQFHLTGFWTMGLTGSNNPRYGRKYAQSFKI
jgi:hypothetical protein